MSKPINCPACGARMDAGSAGDTPWVLAWLQCSECGLRSDHYAAETRRGAAIKAGRAMRAICEAVEVRIAERDNASFAHGLREGRRSAARVAWKLLRDRKLTRRQITERMIQEAGL